MPKVQSIRGAANNSTCHLASAARQSASYSSLPFKGMSPDCNPVNIATALTVHKFFPHAEWIRVKTLSNGRYIITLKASGLKATAKGYGHDNAIRNLILRIGRIPGLLSQII